MGKALSGKLTNKWTGFFVSSLEEGELGGVDLGSVQLFHTATYDDIMMQSQHML